MYKYGVKPHFVTSLERVPEVVPFFEGIEPELIQNTWLAACPVVVPEVYDTYKGPKVIVYRDFAHFRWLGIDKGILRIGPSCANMSFKIAEALGCNPIILVGQDLAFAPTGESHIDGHLYGKDMVKPRKDAFYVKGNYSEKVLTYPVWYMFLKHFELDIADYPGICINATEGGAYITGTKVMKLAEAIEEYVREPFTPEKIIRETLGTVSIETTAKDLEKFTNVLNETKAFVEQVVTQYEEMLQEVQDFNKNILQEILKRTEDVLYEEEKERAKELHRKIQELKSKTMQHQLFYLYLMHVVQPYVINSEVELASCFEKYENFNFSYIEWVAKHEEWYKVMIGLIKECEKRLFWAEDVVENTLRSLRSSVRDQS